MKSTNQLRKEVKRINWKIETLSNFKQSPNSLSLQNPQLNLQQSIEALNLNAKAIENYFSGTMSTSVHVDQIRSIKTSGSQMKKVASMKRKVKLDNDTIYGNMALAFDSFDFNSPNYFSNQSYSGKDQVIVSERKEHDNKDFTNNHAISYLLFPSGNHGKATPEQLSHEQVMEKILQLSIKSFLLTQDSLVFNDFPLIDKLKLDFTPFLLSSTMSPLKSLVQDSHLVYAIQTAATSLNKAQLQQDTQLNSNTAAKETSKILNDITLNNSYLKALLYDWNKPHKISLIVNQHIVLLNRRINELESLAYGLMTSINKSFDVHLQNFLVVFAKVYLLFHATVTHKFSKTLMESPMHKYFIDEALKLRFQQNQITHLLGKMFKSLKKTMMGYYKLTIEKETKKNTFNLKTEFLDKKQKVSQTSQDMDVIASLLKNEHNKHFTVIFKTFIDTVSGTNFTEKWRDLLPQNNLNIQEAYQNMELLLKVNMIGSFLETTTSVFASKKPQVNFAGIIVFALKFFDIINTIFDSAQGGQKKKAECVLGIPEYNNFKNFVIALIFLTNKEMKDKNPYASNLIDSKNDYSWIKKVRSANFNKPEGITIDMITKLLVTVKSA